MVFGVPKVTIWIWWESTTRKGYFKQNAAWITSWSEYFSHESKDPNHFIGVLVSVFFYLAKHPRGAVNYARLEKVATRFPWCEGGTWRNSSFSCHSRYSIQKCAFLAWRYRNMDRWWANSRPRWSRMDAKKCTLSDPGFDVRIKQFCRWRFYSRCTNDVNLPCCPAAQKEEEEQKYNKRNFFKIFCAVWCASALQKPPLIALR